VLCDICVFKVFVCLLLCLGVGRVCVCVCVPVCLCVCVPVWCLCVCVFVSLCVWCFCVVCVSRLPIRCVLYVYSVCVCVPAGRVCEWFRVCAMAAPAGPGMFTGFTGYSRGFHGFLTGLVGGGSHGRTARGFTSGPGPSPECLGCAQSDSPRIGAHAHSWHTPHAPCTLRTLRACPPLMPVLAPTLFPCPHAAESLAAGLPRLPIPRLTASAGRGASCAPTRTGRRPPTAGRAAGCCIARGGVRRQGEGLVLAMFAPPFDGPPPHACIVWEACGGKGKDRMVSFAVAMVWGA
jgi:hypothetical protein